MFLARFWVIISIRQSMKSYWCYVSSRVSLLAIKHRTKVITDAVAAILDEPSSPTFGAVWPEFAVVVLSFPSEIEKKSLINALAFSYQVRWRGCAKWVLNQWYLQTTTTSINA